jgi:hypothetical protein
VSLKRVELGVLGILLIGIILYAGSGVVYSTLLTAGADRTLNTVVSHENSVSASFNEIDNEVSALNGNANFDPGAAVALVDRSVANSELATATINQDDASLASLQRDIASSRWLTVVAHTTLDRQSARIAHARNALAAARLIAADEGQDGHFWRSLYSALADLDTLINQDGSGDYTTAKTTLTTLKTDVDQATRQSTAPGLPADLHNLMTDMQTFVSDYGKQLDAQVAQDDSSVAQYQASLDADRTKLGAYNVDQIGSEIDAFYKPLILRFNTEIAAATA